MWTSTFPAEILILGSADVHISRYWPGTEVAIHPTALIFLRLSMELFWPSETLPLSKTLRLGCVSAAWCQKSGFPSSWPGSEGFSASGSHLHSTRLWIQNSCWLRWSNCCAFATMYPAPCRPTSAGHGGFCSISSTAFHTLIHQPSKPDGVS